MSFTTDKWFTYLTITLSNKYDNENYSQNFYVVEIGSFKYTK